MPGILSGGRAFLLHSGHHLKTVNGALGASVGSPLKWGPCLPCRPERVAVPGGDLSLRPPVITLCCVQAHFSTGGGASWKPARCGKHLRTPRVLGVCWTGGCGSREGLDTEAADSGRRWGPCTCAEERRRGGDLRRELQVPEGSLSCPHVPPSPALVVPTFQVHQASVCWQRGSPR